MTLFKFLREKCLFVSLIIVFISFIFISQTMSKGYLKKEYAYKLIISKLIHDKNYYKDFKNKFGEKFKEEELNN